MFDVCIVSSPALSALGNAVYKIAMRFHLIPTSVPHDVESGYSQLPGGARAEAERRRYAHDCQGMAMCLI